MPVLRYDERDLWKRLERMPNRLRVAFAAACAHGRFQTMSASWKLRGRGILMF